MLGAADNACRQETSSETRSVAEKANPLALQIRAADVGEQASQTTPDTSAVHVTAKGGNLETRGDALAETFLRQRHEGLLDDFVGQGLLVVHVADLTRHLAEYLLARVREVVVVEQAGIRLLDQLAGGGVETHVVEPVERRLRRIGAIAVRALQPLLALNIITVGSIKGLGVAGQGEVTVHDRVLAGEIGLVEVVGVLHVGAPQTRLNDNRSVGANQHSDTTSTTSGSSVALGIEGNVTSNNDSISAIPRRRLDPVDAVEQSVGTTIASIHGINSLQVGVVPEKLHQDGLDGLGFVEDRLGTDLEATNRVSVDVVVLKEPGDGG